MKRYLLILAALFAVTLHTVPAFAEGCVPRHPGSVDSSRCDGYYTFGNVVTFSNGIALNGATDESASEVSFSCRNESGGAFANGDLVYVTGWDTTDVPLMVLADADAGLPAHAVMAAALANNTTGTCYTRIEATSLNTSAAAAEGDEICLTPTATTGNTWAVEASCTTVADEFRQVVGVVTVDHASTGAILFDLRSQDIRKIGTTQIQGDAIDGTKIADDAVGAEHIEALDATLEFIGTAPTPSSCGTTPAVVGSDMAGKVTVGSSASAVDGCVLTFATAKANAPACMVIGEDSAISLAATTSTTALTITSTAAGDPSGDVWMYLCVGQDAD